MVEIEINFQELIAKKDWKNLKRELNGYDPFHIAEIIEDLEEQEAIILFRLLSREQAKETFQFLSHEKQEEIVVGLAHNINKITSLLNDLDPDDRTAFFEELPDSHPVARISGRQHRATDDPGICGREARFHCRANARPYPEARKGFGDPQCGIYH